MKNQQLDDASRASRALLVLFFAGFLTIVGASTLISSLIDDIKHRLANEQARLFIGEQVVNSIRDIESTFYQLAPTTGEAAKARLTSQILERTDKLEHDLKVLQTGGTVRQRIALNIEGQDEMVRELSYTPQPDDDRYVLEAIEIARATGSTVGETTARGILGIGEQMLGEWAASEANLRRTSGLATTA